MVKKALLVGINYKGQSGELRGCINDVRNVSRMLKRDQQFPSGNIRLLTDIHPRKPTKQGILEGIEWLVKNAKAGDCLYFHYSGHGSYVKDVNNDEEDGKDETLVPLDYRTEGLIIDDDLRRLLADRIPQGCKLTAILDACHSGTGLDLRYVLDTTRLKSQRRRGRWYWKFNVKEDTHYSETQGDVVFLSGCRDPQYSADTYKGGQAVGALTWAYLRSLKRYRRRQAPTHATLLKRVRYQLMRSSYPQQPIMGFGRQDLITERFSIV